MRMRIAPVVLTAVVWISTGAQGIDRGAQTVPAAEPRLWVYPAPGQDDYHSEYYRVSVEQDSRAHETFCYQARSIWHNEFPDPWTAKSFPKENNWVNFSFGGKVTVVVEPLKVKAVGVELRPDPAGVKASVAAGKVRVEISRPGQYYVMVKAEGDERHDFDHPLFIFANPPETQVPAKGTPDVHYFGPGVHEIGFQYRVKAGQTVYIAGGAMVKGSLFYEGDGVKILGRGILTDRKLMLERVKSALAERAAGKAAPWDLNGEKMYRDKWATIYGEEKADGALIEGITIIESPHYMVRTHGAGTVFRNLKLMGDVYNNNGIIAGTNHKILDCFLKVEDDVFCWMAPVSETRNCVIWKQDNACMVQMGYGYGFATHGHVFADNWVIVDRTEVQPMARGLFGLASSTGTTFAGCRIENLKVYGDVLNFLAIDNRYRPTPWSAPPEAGMKLRPVELHFKNVEITGTERGHYWGPWVEDLKGTPMRSRLRAEKDGTIHVILENVRINGKRLKSDADWPNGLLTQGHVTVEYRSREPDKAQARPATVDGVADGISCEGRCPAVPSVAASSCRPLCRSRLPRLPRCAAGLERGEPFDHPSCIIGALPWKRMRSCRYTRRWSAPRVSGTGPKPSS